MACGNVKMEERGRGNVRERQRQRDAERYIIFRKAERGRLKKKKDSEKFFRNKTI